MSKWFAPALAAVLIAAAITLCFNAASSADAVRTGAFSGASHHKASGHVEVVTEGGVTKVVFKDDFTLQEAPAPRLAWGKDGYKRGTIFAKLGNSRARRNTWFRQEPRQEDHLATHQDRHIRRQ
jgi:hypothetical protein